MQVETREFEFSHGKKPRGRGHWAFFFDGQRNVDKAFWAQGTFAEASKAAKEEAKKRGAHSVAVGS